MTTKELAKQAIDREDWEALERLVSVLKEKEYMGKWSASATYHDKKKDKLWISVILQDLNNYIEKWEHNYYILCIVEFVKGNEPKINFSIPNGRGTKGIELTEHQKELVINAAVETSKKYL